MILNSTHIKDMLPDREIYVVMRDEDGYYFTGLDQFIEDAGCALVEMITECTDNAEKALQKRSTKAEKRSTKDEKRSTTVEKCTGKRGRRKKTEGDDYDG